MVKIETKNFNFRLWIKDKKSEEIIELSKSDNLEVKWSGSRGIAKKMVVFEKDGKKYPIVVRIWLEKYLLGMRWSVGDWKFFAPSKTFYEVYGGYMGEPNNSPEKDIERQHYAKIANQWNVGRIFFFFVIIITIVIVFAFWKRKKRKL